MLVVSSFTATVLIFLFLPVIKLRRSLESEQNKLLNELENDIAEGIRQCALDNDSGFGKNIEQMESEKETLSSYRFRAFSPRDKARIAACITLIPVSWLVLLLTEWLIHLTYY